MYKNDIVYNTMRMWQGSSGLSRYNGIVSPAYTVVITTGDNNPEFFSYYFKYYKLIKVFQKHSQGLTSDTWNLKYPAFSKIFILVPSLKTQNEIVVILKKLDSLITYNESVLNNINEIKKGLLQQLFI